MKRFLKKLGQGNKGFTLIELLIVVAIIGVLAGVVMANMSDLFGHGETEAMQAELITVQTAADAYMAKNLQSTITARANAAVIATGDADCEFIAYLRSLPTEYLYAWTDTGEVTQSSP